MPEEKVRGKYKVHVTDEYYRYRQHPPKIFNNKSFRTITVHKDPLVKAIRGRVKQIPKDPVIQSILVKKR